MAASQLTPSSDISRESCPMFPPNDNRTPSEMISNNEYDLSMINSNLKLAWTGDFTSIKCLVREHLKLDGVWTSPGGEKKVFICNNIPTISWWQKKKLVEFYGANASTIRQKLFATMSDGNVMKDSDVMPTQFKTNNTPICSCNELSIDLEGIKLDLTISEAKQDKTIDYNTRVIEQIRTDVNNMQIQYRMLNEKISEINNAMETLRLFSENSFLSQTLGNLAVALENHGIINEENKSCSSPLSQSEKIVTVHANSDASSSPSIIEVNKPIKQNKPMPRASVSCLASPAISTITFNDQATQNNQLSHKCASTLVDLESKHGRKEGNKFVKWQETSNSQSASQINPTLNTSSSRSVQPDFNKQLDEYKKKHATLVHDIQPNFDNQLQEYRQKHKGSESHTKQGIPNRKPTAQLRHNAIKSSSNFNMAETRKEQPVFNEQLQNYKVKHARKGNNKNKGKSKYPKQKESAKDQKPNNSAPVHCQSFFLTRPQIYGRTREWMNYLQYVHKVTHSQ